MKKYIPTAEQVCAYSLACLVVAFIMGTAGLVAALIYALVTEFSYVAVMLMIIYIGVVIATAQSWLTTGMLKRKGK